MTSIGRRLGISLFVSLLLAGLLISQGALWWRPGCSPPLAGTGMMC